ncbi:MAG: carbohydrate ABC transporter permease [Clostridiales bacterium]|nr:carbohydrate ABC transporter permease [Clostridiales bacterium]
MRTGDQKRWLIVSHIVMVLMSLAALLPFALLVIASFTDDDVAMVEGYSFTPSKLSLDAYRYLADNAMTFVRAYGVTILVTVIGTVVCIILTALTAYVLSNEGLPGGKILSFMVIFTMLFNGGIVATYINYVTIFNIKNTIWALIVPNLMMNAFQVVLMRNYYKNSIPVDLYEAARIDGAGEIYIFGKIALPLSGPMLATVGLMGGIAYWNDWQNSLYYIDNKNLYSIQAWLNAINDSISVLSSLGSTSGVSAADLPTTTMRMAIAVVGILPILVIYPIFQKYFAAGLIAGAVKG